MINLWMLAGAAAVLLCVSPAWAQSTDSRDAKPTYCAGAGAYRLPECGLTEKQALEAEAAVAAARSPTYNRSSSDAAFQYLSQQAKKICDSKPISQMTMADIEDCNKPMMRTLRSPP